MAVFNDGVVETNAGADAVSNIATFAAAGNEPSSPNLIQNGGFDTSSSWTCNTGAAISGGVATFNNSSLNAAMYQAAGLVVGTMLEVTFRVTAYTAGTIKPYSTGTTPRSAVGTYTERYSHTGTTNFAFDTLGFTGSIDDVSVRVITTVDYTDGNKNLLVQESTRPNLLKSPNDFTNPAWYLSATAPTTCSWTKDTITYIGDGVNNCYIAQQMKGLQGGRTYIIKMVARSNVAGQRMFWSIQGNGTGFSSSGSGGTLDVADKTFIATVNLPTDGNYITFSIGQITNYNAFTGNEMILTVTDISVSPALAEQSNFIGNFISDGVGEQVAGAELVVNGTFTGGTSSWTSNAGIATTFEVVADGAHSEALHIISPSSNGGAAQTLAGVVGRTYLVSYDCKVVSGSFYAGRTDTMIGGIRTTANSAGWVTVTAPWQPTIDTNLWFYSIGASEFYVDNVSIRQVGVYDTDSAAAAQAATIAPPLMTFIRGSVAINSDGSYVSGDTPRFGAGKDTDTALLIEEGTTNLAVPCEFAPNISFDPWRYQYSINGYCKANQEMRYLGKPSLQVARTDVGTESNTYYQLNGLVPNAVYTYSAWVWADANTAAIWTSNASVNMPRTSHPGDGTWRRLTGQFTSSGTGAAQLRFGFYGTTGPLTSTYMVMPQVEKKPYATSFTPGTRATESCSLLTVSPVVPGTIECWAQAAVVTSDYQMPFSAWPFFYVAKSPAGKPFISWKDGSNLQRTLAATGNIDVTGWHHWALVWTPTNLKLYVDGALVCDSGVTSIYPTPYLLGLGAATSYPWDGYISSVRVSNIARSSADILASYNNPTGMTWDANTTAFYPLAAPDTFGADTVQSAAAAAGARIEAASGAEASTVTSVATAQALSPDTGPELLVGGDFSSSTGWLRGTGWSVAGGVAHSDGTGTHANLSRNVGAVRGKVYLVTYTVLNLVSGAVSVTVGGYDYGAVRSTNGTFTDVIRVNYPTADGTFYIHTQPTFVGDVENVSVKELLAPTTDTPAGTYVTTASTAEAVINTTDSISALAALVTDLTEIGVAAEGTGATQTAVALALEAAGLFEVITASQLSVASLLEVAALADGMFGTSLAAAYAAEALAAGDAGVGVADLAGGILESLDALAEEQATYNTTASAKEKAFLQTATYLLAEIVKRTSRDNQIPFRVACPDPVFTATELPRINIEGTASPITINGE